MSHDSFFIPRNREMLITPASWNLITQTSPITKSIHGDVLQIERNILNNTRLNTVILQDDWDRVGNHIAEKLFTNENYFTNVSSQQDKAIQHIHDFLGEIKTYTISTFTTSQLLDLVTAIQERWLEYDMINVPPWFIGGDTFKNRVQEYLSIPEQDFLFLTTPEQKTFVSQLEQELLDVIYNFKKGTISNLEEIAQTLSEKYGWIPFGYDGLVYWDSNHFVKIIKEDERTIEILEKEIRSIKQVDQKNSEKRDSLIKQHNFDKNQLEYIEKINVLNVWTDERKMLEFRLHYWYSQILLEFEKRYNVPYINLKLLLTQELPIIETLSAKEIIEKTHKRITELFVIEARNGNISILEGKEKEDFLKDYHTHMAHVTAQTEIKGMVASKGPQEIYTGTAKVVLRPEDGEKVQLGDFVIATMTTPDYIMCMKQASGFVTDEGGVTCHAAIVGREMNKPTIIATKNATQIINDGDTIEINTGNGTVKVI